MLRPGGLNLSKDHSLTASPKGAFAARYTLAESINGGSLESLLAVLTHRHLPTLEQTCVRLPRRILPGKRLLVSRWSALAKPV